LASPTTPLLTKATVSSMRVDACRITECAWMMVPLAAAEMRRRYGMRSGMRYVPRCL